MDGPYSDIISFVVAMPFGMAFSFVLSIMLASFLFHYFKDKFINHLDKARDYLELREQISELNDVTQNLKDASRLLDNAINEELSIAIESRRSVRSGIKSTPIASFILLVSILYVIEQGFIGGIYSPLTLFETIKPLAWILLLGSLVDTVITFSRSVLIPSIQLYRFSMKLEISVLKIFTEQEVMFRDAANVLESLGVDSSQDGQFQNVELQTRFLTLRKRLRLHVEALDLYDRLIQEALNSYSSNGSFSKVVKRTLFKGCKLCSESLLRSKRLLSSMDGIYKSLLDHLEDGDTSD